MLLYDNEPTEYAKWKIICIALNSSSKIFAFFAEMILSLEGSFNHF